MRAFRTLRGVLDRFGIAAVEMDDEGDWVERGDVSGGDDEQPRVPRLVTVQVSEGSGAARRSRGRRQAHQPSRTMPWGGPRLVVARRPRAHCAR